MDCLYFVSSSCLVKSLTINGIEMLILLEYLSHSVVCTLFITQCLETNCNKTRKLVKKD